MLRSGTGSRVVSVTTWAWLTRYQTSSLKSIVPPCAREIAYLEQKEKFKDLQTPALKGDAEITSVLPTFPSFSSSITSTQTLQPAYNLLKSLDRGAQHSSPGGLNRTIPSSVVGLMLLLMSLRSHRVICVEPEVIFVLFCFQILNNPNIPLARMACFQLTCTRPCRWQAGETRIQIQDSNSTALWRHNCQTNQKDKILPPSILAGLWSPWNQAGDLVNLKEDPRPLPSAGGEWPGLDGTFLFVSKCLLLRYLQTAKKQAWAIYHKFK